LTGIYYEYRKVYISVMYYDTVGQSCLQIFHNVMSE